MKKRKVYAVILETARLYGTVQSVEAIFSSRKRAKDYINNGYYGVEYDEEEDYWIWDHGDETNSYLYISEYILNETRFDRDFRRNEEMKGETENV